jgi:hypothetical protein
MRQSNEVGRILGEVSYAAFPVVAVMGERVAAIWLCEVVGEGVFGEAK